jgi:hypothetical protein
MQLANDSVKEKKIGFEGRKEKKACKCISCFAK